MRRPYVGQIEFLNCFPLYYALVKNNVLWDIDLIKGTPAELNRRLLQGYDKERVQKPLDICSISSIVYAQNWRDLVLMPNLSISSDGEVMSVCLVSKKSIDQLDGGLVALTNTSATSHILLKIILADKYNVRPNYVECAPSLDEMLKKADAALLIGDPALAVNYQKPSDIYIYDLGKEWKELSGGKMVYGLWVIRRDFALRKKELAREVSREFTKAMRESLTNIEEVAREAAKWEDYPPAFLKDYFLTLKYIFDEQYQQGLLEYYHRAKAHNFLSEAPPLDFLEV